MKNKKDHTRHFLFPLLTLLLFIAGTPLQSQYDPVAENRKILSQLDTLQGEAKALAYCDLATNYQFNPTKLDSVKFYASKALVLSEELGFMTGAQKAHYYLGSYYMRKAEEIDLGLFHFRQLAELIKKTGNTERLPQVLNAIGTCLLLEGKYEHAADTFLLCQQGAKANGDLATFANAATNLGIVYTDLELIDKAISINQDALSHIALDTTPDKHFSELSILANLSSQFLIAKQLDSARTHLDRMGLLLVKNNVGNYSARFYELTMTYLEQIGDKNRLYIFSDSILQVFAQTGNIDQFSLAGAYYFNAISAPDQRSKLRSNIAAIENILATISISEQAEIHDMLYDLNKLKNNPEQALYHLEQNKQLTDTLLNERLGKRIIALQSLYELEKKEKQIQKSENEKLILQNRNGLLLRILLAAGMIALLGYLLFARKRRKEQEKMYQIEQKMLALQMNPHFIFNAISSIQNYLFDEKDRKSAIIHLSTFATLMRQILENNREKFISLAEEISFLNNYLNLQKLRFENKFDFKIEVSPDIDAENTSIPPLLTQPFVENSIEHGKIHTVENGLLQINIKKSNGIINIEILDNGIGIQQAKLKATNSIKKKSLSLSITKERLHLLSKLLRQEFHYSVHSQETGTEVQLHIPLVPIH